VSPQHATAGVEGSKVVMRTLHDNTTIQKENKRNRYALEPIEPSRLMSLIAKWLPFKFWNYLQWFASKKRNIVKLHI